MDWKKTFIKTRETEFVSRKLFKIFFHYAFVCVQTLT